MFDPDIRTQLAASTNQIAVTCQNQLASPPHHYTLPKRQLHFQKLIFATYLFKYKFISVYNSCYYNLLPATLGLLQITSLIK